MQRPNRFPPTPPPQQVELEFGKFKVALRRLIDATVGERANLARQRGMIEAWREQAAVAQRASELTVVFDEAVSLALTLRFIF